MSERTWRIDPGLAADLAAGLGWDPGDGVAALTARLPEQVPAGSTAKLSAIAAGDVPSGADVDHLARALVDHQHALADPPERGAPSPSWSCWVFTSAMAALVDWADLGPVQVAALRRIDEAAPMVDFHAAVVVGDGVTPLVCDPYFGAVVELPAEPGHTEVARLGPATAAVARGADGGWLLDTHLGRWAEPLRYRLVAPALDRDDVRAFCAVSAVHSGVPSRPYARLHRPGPTVVDVTAHEGGGAAVRTWEDAAGEGVETVEERATWEQAAADFAARTGVRIT